MTEKNYDKIRKIRILLMGILVLGIVLCFGPEKMKAEEQAITPTDGQEVSTEDITVPDPEPVENPVVHLTISFYIEVKDTTPYATITMEANTTPVLPAAPVLEGFTFAGWTDGNGAAVDIAALTEDISVYASFTAGAKQETTVISEELEKPSKTDTTDKTEEKKTSSTPVTGTIHTPVAGTVTVAAETNEMPQANTAAGTTNPQNTGKVENNIPASETAAEEVTANEAEQAEQLEEGTTETVQQTETEAQEEKKIIEEEVPLAANTEEENGSPVWLIVIALAACGCGYGFIRWKKHYKM